MNQWLETTSLGAARDSMAAWINYWRTGRADGSMLTTHLEPREQRASLQSLPDSLPHTCSCQRLSPVPQPPAKEKQRAPLSQLAGQCRTATMPAVGARRKPRHGPTHSTGLLSTIPCNGSKQHQSGPSLSLVREVVLVGKGRALDSSHGGYFLVPPSQHAAHLKELAVFQDLVPWPGMEGKVVLEPGHSG